MFPDQGYMLRIYIREKDKYKGEILYEWIVKMAREYCLAGVTVLCGINGFGAHSRLHPTRIRSASDDSPIVIEIVDTLNNLELFLSVIDEAITDGLATLEHVEMKFYRRAEKNKMKKYLR